MFYVIDEDEIQLKPLRLELDLRGIANELIPNADEALRLLPTFQPTDYLAIDVMLAVNPEEGRSSFSRDETEDYKLTGLKLVEKIVAAPSNFPLSHIILMSQAASKRMIDRIAQFAKQHGIIWLSKSAYDDPVPLGDQIESIIRRPSDQGSA